MQSMHAINAKGKKYFFTCNRNVSLQNSLKILQLNTFVSVRESGIRKVFLSTVETCRAPPGERR